MRRLTISREATLNSELLESSMQKLKQGDIKALDEIFRITSDVVYIMAYSILKNKERAEDIVQDTYIRVYKKIHKYNPNTNAAGWICRIARNLSCDEYVRRRDISLEVFEGNLLDSHASERLTESVYLKTVFDTLNQDEREVVALFAVGSFKHREIAQILGKPMGTVQWIYNKAVKKLKEILNRNDDNDMMLELVDRNNSEVSLNSRIEREIN